MRETNNGGASRPRIDEGLLLASLGLALCFVFRSTDRYTAIAFPNQDSLFDSVLMGVSRLAPLLVLTLIYHRRLQSSKGVATCLSAQGIFISHAPRLIFLALMASVGLSVLYISSFGLPVTAETITIGKMLLGVANTLFLVAYAELVLPQGRTVTVTVFVTASFTFGVLRIALGLLSPQAALVLLLLCPAFSCLCLYEATGRQRPFAHDAAYPGVSSCPARHSKAGAIEPGDAYRPFLSGQTISLLASIAAYTFIFSALHMKWLNPQSSSPFVTIALQMAPGLGIMAGAFFVSKARKFLTIERVASYSMLLPPLVIAVLYLSTFASDYLLIVFAIPLFAVQRMVFFLIWVIADAQEGSLQRMRMFCIGMSCLELGTSAFYCTAGIGRLAGNTEEMLFFPTVLVLGVLVTQQVATWLLSEKKQSEERARAAEEAAIKNDVDMIPQEMALRINAVADYYKLTKRERELLPYLMLGRAPDYIGRAMFIEPSTVKTHLKNIYRKTNVGKRTELLLLIENWSSPKED